MAAIFVTPQVNLARYAGALFNLQLGTSYTKDLVAAAPSLSAQTTLFNDIYKMSFGSATATSVATTLVANLGITTGSADAIAYIKAQLEATPSASRGAVVADILNLFSGLTTDATYGSAAAAWNDKVTAAVEYGKTAAGNTSFGAVLEFNLIAGLDQVTGTSGADVFTAYLAGNNNTLESGDKIDGGAGADTLNAVLGDSSNFAITPIVKNVETVSIRAQSNDANGNNGSNNIGTQQVTLDAQNFTGVTNWINSNSRADLVIEDVRIADSQITKDITITLADTDPASLNGKTDFELYFSPESLRKASAITQNSSLTLTLNDNKGVSGQEVPTLDIIVKFTTGGKQYSLRVNSGATGATQDATTGVWSAGGTYEQFVTNLNKALSDAGLSTVTAAVGPAVPSISVTKVDGTTTVQATPLCKAVVLTDATGALFSAQSFTTATGGASYSVDGTATLGGATQVGYLITSTIVLDNVGREGEAGHLLVGGMGTQSGVERFEITVNNNDNTSGAHTASGSWLSNMSSTNNQLREVTAKNAAAGIDSPDYLYIGTNTDTANNNLTTLQAGYTAQAVNAYGAAASFAQTYVNTDGLTDVRLFDASAMKGNVKIGALVDAAALVKYQDLMDSAHADKTDDIAFSYLTGSGNDSISLAIDGNVAASNGNINAGRHDFTFAVDGGAGDDNITVQIGDGTLTNGAWYINQQINQNVTISGGEGNDTIRKPGPGDTTINGGAGNDTIYTDNTGTDTTVFNTGKATWVFNTASVTTAANIDSADLVSATAATAVKAVNVSLTVTYKGLASTVVVGNSKDALVDVSITDLSINQAIKAAINSDPVLSKLLVAEDNAGRTLVVKSLIDGVQVATDLSVGLTADTLSAAQTAAGVHAFGNALGFTAGVADVAGRFDSTFAKELGTGITGADSTVATDNIVTGGTGNDVIVLGTAISATAGDVLGSSNDTVVFSGLFGNDTIVHFTDATTSANGADKLDFTAYLGGAAAGLNGAINTDKEVTIAAKVAGTNDTLALVKGLYTDDTTANKGVYIVTSNGVGTVYSVADGTAASDIAVTLVGTIDLADTSWAALTAANLA